MRCRLFQTVDGLLPKEIAGKAEPVGAQKDAP
jgi:hypothetical protein